MATVSRALGKGERISADTIRKVREAAARLGYVRNQAAVKLRTGRTMRIFLLLAAGDEDIGDPTALGLYSGVFAGLQGTEYSLRLVPVDGQDRGMAVLREIVEGQLGDGVVLDAIEQQDPRLAYLGQAQLPHVGFGRSALPSQPASFSVDERFSAWQSTDALLHRGARRVGLLNPPPELVVAAQRARGFDDALAAHGQRDPQRWIRTVEHSADASRAAALTLIQDGADGLVCPNEVSMLGALAAARDLGRRPGRDLFLSARVGNKLAQYLSVPVTLSYYPHADAGERLAALLLAQLDPDAPQPELHQRARTRLVDPIHPSPNPDRATRPGQPPRA